MVWCGIFSAKFVLCRVPRERGRGGQWHVIEWAGGAAVGIIPGSCSVCQRVFRSKILAILVDG